MGTCVGYGPTQLPVNYVRPGNCVEFGPTQLPVGLGLGLRLELGLGLGLRLGLGLGLRLELGLGPNLIDRKLGTSESARRRCANCPDGFGIQS